MRKKKKIQNKLNKNRITDCHISGCWRKNAKRFQVLKFILSRRNENFQFLTNILIIEFHRESPYGYQNLHTRHHIHPQRIESEKNPKVASKVKSYFQEKKLSTTKKIKKKIVFIGERKNLEKRMENAKTGGGADYGYIARYVEKMYALYPNFQPTIAHDYSAEIIIYNLTPHKYSKLLNQIPLFRFRSGLHRSTPNPNRQKGHALRLSVTG